MWNFMSQNQDGFVNKSELGIKKVTTGKYVSNALEIFYAIYHRIL